MHHEPVNGTNSTVRIPSKRSLWRDPRLLGGLLLIALSIAACTLLISQARSGDLIYRTTRAVAQGEELTAANTEIIEARPGTDAYVADGAMPDHAIATRSLGQGELVPASAVSDQADAARRRLVVTVADGLPQSVKAGDLLELWALPGQYAQADAEDKSTLITGDVILVGLEEDRSVSHNGTRIEILISQSAVPSVLDATSGNGALAAVPIGR